MSASRINLMVLLIFSDTYATMSVVVSVTTATFGYVHAMFPSASKTFLLATAGLHVQNPAVNERG